MNTIKIKRLFTLLALLFGVMSAASAANTFSAKALSISPGQTTDLEFTLTNDTQFYGFQVEIQLPTGLEFVNNSSGKAYISLSLSRLGNSYQLVTNLVDTRNLKVGAFSDTHTAITGSTGTLFSAKVKATSTFTGGTIEVTNIRLTNSDDKDVPVSKSTATATKVDAKVTAITLNKTTLDIKVNEKATLSVTNVTPDYAANKNVTWSSSDESVATVSSTGEVTGQGKGTATITATAADGSGTKANCTVNVTTIPVTNIKLSDTSCEIIIGQTKTLTATVTPTNATNAKVNWSSSNPSYATVDANGKVTAVAVGSATITATAADGSGVKATCTVTVKPILVTSITLPDTKECQVGQKFTLTPTIAPSNATDKSVTWTSSLPTVATIDAQGNVTPLSLGETTITVKANDASKQSATCKVTVVATPAKEVTLNKNELKLKVSEYETLTATVLPTTATNKNVIWNSDKESVATVDNTGKVTAITVGTANITATAADGSGVKATCTVTVNPILVTSISLPATTECQVGQKFTLTPTISPTNATDKSVTWTSSKPEVATIDAQGNVTPLALGETTITVKANDASKQSATCKVTVVATPAESVTLDQTSVTIKDSESVQLIATVKPDNTTNKTVTWTSKNKDVATVNSDGLVTAVKVGTTTITATCGAESATCTVTVTATPAESVILDKTSVTIKDSESVQLIATVKPDNTTNKTVTWTSKNKDVATVNSDGLVTAVKVGTTTITATCGAESATCTVTVIATLAEEVTLNKSAITLKATETFNLTASVSPETTTDKTVKWTSDKESVATVNADGLVTAVKEGAATITAICGEASATCVVTVEDTPAEEVTLNQTAITLKATETFALTATISPETTTDKTVTWASSDSKIATVNDNGKVTAIAVGTATITATCGEASATCVVTVAETLAKSITIDPTSLSIKVGEKGKLTATVTPATTTNKIVSWTSSDETIATVASDGTVTGLKSGNVTITATIDGQKATASVSVIKTPDGLVAALGATQLKQGESTTLTVSLNGAENFAYKALKFSISLPEGIKIEKAEFNPELPSTCNVNTEIATPTCMITGTLETSVTSDLVTFTLKADDEASVGVKEIGLTDIILVSTPLVNLDNKTYSLEVLSKFIPVETVTLSTENLSVQLDSHAVITATVAPTDATDKEIDWSVEDETIVSFTVSGNKVTIEALSLGETTITARAKGGDGVSASATIKVIPVPAKSITIEDNSVTTLKERETNQLTAVVTPENTTYPDVEWSSSNSAVATVDQNGLVTAVGKGTVEITAKVKATPSITATYKLTVEALLLGDSNEDEKVDVFDVVNIASYIVGKNPQPFCFVASDIIWDKEINVADQNAAINIALGLPVVQPTKAAVNRSAKESGNLSAVSLSATSDGKIIVPVTLSSEIAYSSLQANVILPEGIEVAAVRTTSATSSFSILYNVTNDGVLRTVLYSLDNTPLPSANQAILEIVIDTNGSEGMMRFDNVLAATPGCSLYSLDAETCEINIPAGADSLISDALIVRPAFGAIELINANGKQATILGISGRVIDRFTASSNNELYKISSGMYIVQINDKAFKVNVK